MSQTNKNMENQTVKFSKLAVVSVVLTILSFSLWAVVLTMLLLFRCGNKILIATLSHLPVILILVALIIAIVAAVKIKRSKNKLRGYELVISIIVFAAVGILYSVIAVYGYIRLERRGNRVYGGQLYYSPNGHYLAESIVGQIRDFWGDWKDFHSFTIYENELQKLKYHVSIDLIEPFDKKRFFPNGIGHVVRGGGWEACWSSDSSEVKFSFQEIELKIKIREDNKQNKDVLSP